MIKTTMRDLLTANYVVEGRSAIGALLSIRATGVKALARLRTLEAIENELRRFERARRDVWASHGITTQITEQHPKYAVAVADIEALLNAEVELPGELIPMDDLGVGVLTPLELRALLFWIKTE